MSKLLAPACVLVAFVIGTLAPYPPAMPAIQAQGNLSSGGFFLSEPQYISPTGVADGTVLFADGSESAPAIAFASDTDDGIYHTGASSRWGIVATGEERIRFNQGDVILRATTNLGWDNVGVPNTIALLIDRVSNDTLAVNSGWGNTNETEGRTGRFTRITSHDSVTLSGATTDSTTISIPSGAKIHGCSFTVDTAVVDDAGDDTWSAAFITGSTTTLATGAAPDVDTKVDTLVVDEIASDTTEVQFTPNGGSFTQGLVEIVCYYEELTSLGDA